MLLVHVDSNGIIAQVDEEHRARGLMACSLNDETVYVDVPDNSRYDFNDVNQNYQIIKNNSIKGLPVRYITPEWIDLRTNTILRLKYLKQ